MPLRNGSSRLAALLCLAPIFFACGEAPPAAPPPVEVVVAPVVQRDVAVTTEWIGTTEGAVDAEIRAQVSGYLISRDYRGGHAGHEGPACCSASTRAPTRRRSTRRAAISAAPRRRSARPISTSRASRRSSPRAPSASRSSTTRSSSSAPGAPRSRRRRRRSRRRQLDLALHRDPLADRRHRRRRAGPARRSGRPGRSEATHARLAGRPDPRVVPDPRARVPALRLGDPRAPVGAPRRRSERTGSSWCWPTAASGRTAAAACRLPPASIRPPARS